MADTEFVVESFNALALRIRQKWIALVPATQTFQKQQGWMYTSLTPENVALFSEGISARLDVEFKIRPPSDDDLDRWISFATQAGHLTFENFNSDWVNSLNGTLQFLLVVDSFVPPAITNVDWEAASSRDYLPKVLANKLKGIEDRIAQLGPRSENLDKTISTIEEAKDAANQLPTDLVELGSGPINLLAG
jgi:hypothetical protein